MPIDPLAPPNVESDKQRKYTLASLPPLNVPDARGEGELGVRGGRRVSQLLSSSADNRQQTAGNMRAIGLGSRKWHVAEDLAEAEEDF